jgi:transposase-like protein
MVEGRTLEKSAEIVGVCLKTSFYMRHKILNALDCVQTDTVGGIVEMDETFVAESFKGNHRKGGREIHRKAHKRGKSIRKRGLSNEQVCIGTALDRTGHLIMAMAGHGRVSYDELERLYDGHVVEGSTLCTDSLNSYKKLSGDLKTAHRAVPSGKHSVKVADDIFTLARINSLHSRFKTWLDRFHGVSTRHLGNYLAWFKWIEQVKDMRESAKTGQMWQDVLSELVDVRIETIRYQAPAFV